MGSDSNKRLGDKKGWSLSWRVEQDTGEVAEGRTQRCNALSHHQGSVPCSVISECTISLLGPSISLTQDQAASQPDSLTPQRHSPLSKACVSLRRILWQLLGIFPWLLLFQKMTAKHYLNYRDKELYIKAGLRHQEPTPGEQPSRRECSMVESLLSVV